MGFLDKLKEGAGQAKDMAAAAAERAKEEAKELNLKRQITKEEEALGAITFGLVERGEVSHAELEPVVARIRELRKELEDVQAAQRESGETGSDESAEPPASTPS